MIRRYVWLFALAAVIDVAAGALAWHHHVASLESLLDSQALLAQKFLASESGKLDPTRVLDVASRPGIDVLLHDRSSNAVYFNREGELAPGPMPPLGFPPPSGMPERHRNRFATFAADLAHIKPRTVELGDLSVTLVPSAEALTHFLIADAGICVAVLAGLIIAALITGAALARAAREPLLRTTLALEALAGGNFTPQKIEAGQSPETARLAHAYNAAAQTVASSIEERRAAAAEFQRFLEDAGHELRTPLTIVGGYIDVLAGRAHDKDATEQRVIGGMKSQMARMRAMVEKMLLLSRLESGGAQPRPVEVARVAADVADTMRDAYPGRNVIVKCDPSAAIFIDEDDLYEAQANLVENALRYAPESPVEL
ncbi:MAG TPA: histidine kinase dimerization/phospho-acceptor domain-containing protein, partial [Candidatus Cybelea sp.]|nr:histidine kinase dimerization/phospho-acceptor domain-containing protein [Candidatus Cybelea sp.]